MTTKNKNTHGLPPTAPAPDFLGREFIITREFNAPRRLVWKACTEASHLAQWWGPRGFTAPVCDWDAKPGSKIYVLMRAPNGADFPMGGTFHEVESPKRLVTTTGPLDEKGRLLFEIRHVLTLDEHKGKTRLTMHSTVIKTTPGAGRYIGGFEAGMTQSLMRLGEILTAGGEPLVVERVFLAPVAQVWRALTQLNDVRRWFFDLEEFKPEKGFQFEFAVVHKGFNYRHVCKVTDVIPEKRIAYTWRYKGFKGESLVTYELVSEGKQTRLKLTHEGLETFPKTRAFPRKNFLRGWTYISGALKEFVESPAFDRDMLVSRVVDAPRELVWEAMTNPKHVVNWWGPRGFTATIEKMDFRVGGVWKQVLCGPDGTKYHNEHKFKEIVKPERIVLSHGGKREDGTSVRSVATWTFEAVAPKKTEVRIHMVFPTAEHRDFVVKEFNAIEGGKQTLARLGEYLETM